MKISTLLMMKISNLSPPPKEKRLESKTSKGDKPRKPSQDKARHMKKSRESSCALAAQEVIAFKQYNKVFPSASAIQKQ